MVETFTPNRAYQTPDVKLDLYQGTSGTYAGFDRFGRTVDQYWFDYTSGTVDVDRIKYGYDYAGNRTWREDGVAAANSKDLDEFYTYDGLHRLKSFDRGNLTGGPPPTGIADTPGREQDWGLDQLGNWSTFVNKTAGTTDLDQTRYHNKVNEIDVDDDHSNSAGASITGTPNWVDPKYDAAGNMTTFPQASATSSLVFKYDAWNRLVSGWIPGYESYPGQYEYDGLGRRIAKYIASSSPSYEYYYNEQWQLLEERMGGSSNPLAQYVWHPNYIDALAVRYWDSNTDGSYGGTNEGAHYYCQDANYNVTAVVNASGGVLERYNYTPYGAVTFLNPNFSPASSQTASAIGNTHLYTGRERDAESGLQLNRHRYYASHLGRWLTRDPIGYRNRNFNLYCLVDSRPLTYLDPFGLVSEEIDDVTDVGWWDSWSGYNCKREAEEASADLPGRWGGEQDAVRHCVWLCCMTRSTIPDDQVREIADNHEKHGPTPECDTPPNGYCSQEEWANDDSAMDKYNNEAGIEHGENSPKDCASSCKDSLNDGTLRVNSPGGYSGMSGCGGYY